MKTILNLIFRIFSLNPQNINKFFKLWDFISIIIIGLALSFIYFNFNNILGFTFVFIISFFVTWFIHNSKFRIGLIVFSFILISIFLYYLFINENIIYCSNNVDNTVLNAIESLSKNDVQIETNSGLTNTGTNTEYATDVIMKSKDHFHIRIDDMKKVISYGIQRDIKFFSLIFSFIISFFANYFILDKFNYSDNKYIIIIQLFIFLNITIIIILGVLIYTFYLFYNIY